MTDQNWTNEDKLAALLRLPWTIGVQRDPDGTLVARVAEIPDAIATGENEHELQKDLWDTLAESLRVRLEYGDDVPLPGGQRAPWELGAPKRAPDVRYVEAQVNQSAFVPDPVPDASATLAFPLVAA